MSLRRLTWSTEFKLFAEDVNHPRSAAEKFRKVADQIEKLDGSTWQMILKHMLDDGKPCAGMVGEPVVDLTLNDTASRPSIEKMIKDITTGWVGIWRVEEESE